MCIWMQHLVGVCLGCHCCTSPLGSWFPSRCCTASRWCQFRCVACLFVACADVQIHAASCRFFACIITAVPPLAAGSPQDAALHPIGASSGVWLVYLSHVLTCKYMQHLVDFLPALLLQFPPWQLVPLKMLQCIPLVPVQVCGLFICHMYTDVQIQTS